jgi:hypothetical protein
LASRILACSRICSTSCSKILTWSRFCESVSDTFYRQNLDVVKFNLIF